MSRIGFLERMQPDGRAYKLGMGEVLVKFLDHIEELPENRTKRLVEILLAEFSYNLNEYPLPPLAGALLGAVENIDNGLWSRLPSNFFHVPSHFREVPTCAFVVSHVNAGFYKNEYSSAEMIAAPLLHDIFHPGGTNGDNLYQLERRSADAAATFLRDYHVSEDSIYRIRMIILSTNTENEGREHLRRIHAMHEDGAPLDKKTVPEKFDADLWKALIEDRNLCRLCAITCDADMMSGVYLGMDRMIKARLAFARELNEPTDLASIRNAQVYFLQNVFKGFITPGARNFLSWDDALIRPPMRFPFGRSAYDKRFAAALAHHSLTP